MTRLANSLAPILVTLLALLSLAATGCGGDPVEGYDIPVDGYRPPDDGLSDDPEYIYEQFTMNVEFLDQVPSHFGADWWGLTDMLDQLEDGRTTLKQVLVESARDDTENPNAKFEVFDCMYFMNMLENRFFGPVAQINGEVGASGWNIQVVEAPSADRYCEDPQGNQTTDDPVIEHVTFFSPQDLNDDYGRNTFTEGFSIMIDEEVWESNFVEMRIQGRTYSDDAIRVDFSLVACNKTNPADTRLLIIVAERTEPGLVDSWTNVQGLIPFNAVDGGMVISK